MVPVAPLGVDSEELKAEALFWPTASLEDDTPLLPLKLQLSKHVNSYPCHSKPILGWLKNSMSAKH